MAKFAAWARASLMVFAGVANYVSGEVKAIESYARWGAVGQNAAKLVCRGRVCGFKAKLVCRREGDFMCGNLRGAVTGDFGGVMVAGALSLFRPSSRAARRRVCFAFGCFFIGIRIFFRKKKYPHALRRGGVSYLYSI